MIECERPNPSFKQLFENWIKEEFDGAVVTTDCSEGSLIWLTYCDPPSYTKINRICVGHINGHNVYLNVMSVGNFAIETPHQECKNAADPDLFPWVARTIRNSNYAEACKARIIKALL